MAYTLFIFLPVATCLFWVVVHSLLASRTETYPEFLFLCIVTGIYLFSDACHATSAKGSLLDTGSLLASLFAGPCIIPLIIMYMQKLLPKGSTLSACSLKREAVRNSCRNTKVNLCL